MEMTVADVVSNPYVIVSAVSFLVGLIVGRK